MSQRDREVEALLAYLVVLAVLVLVLWWLETLPAPGHH